MHLLDKLRHYRKEIITHLLAWPLCTAVILSIINYFCSACYEGLLRHLSAIGLSPVSALLIFCAVLITMIIASILCLGRCRSFLQLCKGVWLLSGFIGQFFRDLVLKYVKDMKFRNIIAEALTKNTATCSINIQYELKAYQDALLKFIVNKPIESLRWTNILPPSSIVGSEHNSAFSSFEKYKCRICIIGSENHEEWSRQCSEERDTFLKFEEDSQQKNGILIYASEKGLLDYYGRSVRLGDYGIIEDINHRKMMVSYNPVTENHSHGDVSFTFGNLGNYTRIFDFLDGQDTHKDKVFFKLYENVPRQSKQCKQ